MRSLGLQKRLAIIFAVGMALTILGIDFLVTEETTRGLQEDQENNNSIDAKDSEAMEDADDAGKGGETDEINLSNDLEVHENENVDGGDSNDWATQYHEHCIAHEEKLLKAKMEEARSEDSENVKENAE